MPLEGLPSVDMAVEEAGQFQIGARDAMTLVPAGMDRHKAATKPKRCAQVAEQSASLTENGRPLRSGASARSVACNMAGILAVL